MAAHTHETVDASYSLSPRRIHALGLTYRDHAAETGEGVEAGPSVFERDPASLARGGDLLRVPSRTAILQTLERLEPGLGMTLLARHPDVPPLLDYEIELGLLIVADIREERLADPDFLPPVLGFLANDITVRTVQILGEGSSKRLDFWAAAKSFPGTLLVGPTMRSPEHGEFDVPLTMTVNHHVRQRSSTRELRYSLRHLLGFVARASHTRTLAAGDVVLTGTPGGIALQVAGWQRALADLVLSRFGKLDVAIRRSKKRGARFLRHGDVLDMDGGPLGRLRVEVSETDR
jgi:2-keto-4-pentenoate hydratase/2-oxohepta-3-ene-1,7-dioic acid hydratase in catechol pathway